jgi:DNA-3-methyladenine glycosylase
LRLTPLPATFFNRSPTDVAVDLLCNFLVRQLATHTLVARIVETEAYLGKGDLAAHSSRGRTPRNEVLFGPPGHAYIYVIYGMHLCLNVSTLPPGDAGCVLFRALEPVEGVDEMLRFAPAAKFDRVLSGPGRLTRALALSRALNGCDMTRKSELYLANGRPKTRTIHVTRRIGITKSAELPLRYYVAESAAVTTPRGPVLSIVTK